MFLHTSTEPAQVNEAEGKEKGKEKATGLFVLIMAIACTLPTFATWLYFIVLSGSPAMGPVYSLTKIIQFAMPIPLVLWVFRQRIRLFEGRTAGTLAGVLFGLLTAGAILALYLGYLRQSPVFATFDAALKEKLTGLGADTPGKYLLLAVFISVFHSFLEEYYWRWFVFGQLRQRVKRWVAYLVASVGFAAHHVLVVAAYTGWGQWVWIAFFSIGVAIGGAIWCWMYERNNSLVAPWISHLIVDVALLAVGAIHLWG